jgi:DNA polymerase-3 subunit beta
LVGSAIGTREIKPILRNMKAIAQPDRFMLMATDLEVGIRHELRGLRVEAPGEAILPAARMQSILREATDVDLTVEVDDSKILVHGAVNEYEMAGENPEEFPDIAEFDDEKYYEVPVGALRTMVSRTVFAAAKESGKFAMTGVLWEVEGKHLRLVATDSKRLSLTIGPVTGHGAGDTKGLSHLVPSKAMTLLDRHLQTLPEDFSVKVALRANEALFQTDTTTIYSRLVEGRYPPYREIIPKKATIKIPLAVGPFMTAVRQAAIMTDDETKRVSFKFSDNLLVLQAQGPTAGRSKVPLSVDYSGDTIEVFFDPQYVLEMLRVLEETAPLELDLVDPTRPALFKSGSDYLYLVMPLS